MYMRLMASFSTLFMYAWMVVVYAPLAYATDPHIKYNRAMHVFHSPIAINMVLGLAALTGLVLIWLGPISRRLIVE